MKPPKPVKAWALAWKSIDEQGRFRIFKSQYFARLSKLEGDTIIPVLITPITERKGKRK